MMRVRFNDGWRFGPRQSIYERLTGGEAPSQVTLPHDAILAGGRSADASEGANTGYFRGGSWQYEKTFDVPEAWATKRVTFEFEGVYRDAMVYINNAFAGQWANGYSTFYIPADPYLEYGRANTIRVEAQAHDDSRWYSGGGLYRPVHLLVGELVHITPTGLRVSTPQIDAEVAVAEVATEIANEGTATCTVDVLVEVRDGRGRVVATDRAPATILAGERMIVRRRAYIRTPALWSVDDPNLYSATVRLTDEDGGEVDQSTTTFGVRSLTLDPERGLRINGQTVKLRGACVHHDNGVLGAATFARAEERRVRLLKDAGFNAVRSAHNPLSTAMLDACDRLGMLVMDETFDVWTRSKTEDDYSRRFGRWWEQDVDALVAKDFNHPSVIFYSIGNEILEVGTPHGGRWGRRLAERVRAQDPTRLVTNAVNGMLAISDRIPELIEQNRADGESAEEGLNGFLLQKDELMASAEIGELIAESASVLDVVGLNYAESRYVSDREAFPDRVVVGTETHPTQIERLWELVTENEHVIGDFTWTGWDYLGEAGVGRPQYPGDATFLAPYPWLTAGCGDIDITGRRRPISYYREIVYGLRREPYLAVQRPEHRDHPVQARGWTWTDSIASWTWDVPVGSPITVEAYADADEVAFVLDGHEAARSAVGAEKAFVAIAEIPYRPGTLEAVAYRDGAETGRCRLCSADEPARIELTADRTRIEADGQDLAFVDIAVVDDHGTVHPIGDRTVTVEVTGSATLQALGTARPAGEESFVASSCTTYHGHALAIVRPGFTAGAAAITVRADGLPAATIAIDVQRRPA